jgi:hypothetical protein
MDSILISMDPKICDMLNLIKHLENHKQIYYEVNFLIDKKRFTFPIIGFIHVNGNKIKYAVSIEDILPFSKDHYDNQQLAKNVKPAQWITDWHNNINRLLWKYELVINSIAPFEYDTYSIKLCNGRILILPPRSYYKIETPNEWSGFKHK